VSSAICYSVNVGLYYKLCMFCSR